MALVDYSDSDDSESEAASVPKPSVKPSKGTYQKVVDRSNPGKIRVSLPQHVSQDNEQEDQHAAKRAKTGSSSISDFKSFLPPPKRIAQASGGGLEAGKIMRKTGLIAGISLKTGATPGFSHDGENLGQVSESDWADLDGEDEVEHDAAKSSIAPAKDTSNNEVKLVGKPLMFKPLSVARNPAKKKKEQGKLSTASTLPGNTLLASNATKMEPPVQMPKMSLFTMSTDPSEFMQSNLSREYQPMIYGMSVDKEQDPAAPTTNAYLTNKEYINTPQITTAGPNTIKPGAQSLNEIASDLNLSAADRRQLFGRQNGGAVPQATKIINFNTDEEYQHNEELRAAGEQVVHNPVRAIAPGKHSLKQLVNAAANQKEALEESFAKGKSNRAEASSRYGW